MIMAAVIDPEAFESSCFEQPGYQDQAAMLFRGIESNGLILVDDDGHLWNKLDQAVERLPIKYREDASIHIAELLKHKRSRVAHCRPKLQSSDPGWLDVCRVALATSADALFTSAQNVQRTADEVGPDVPPTMLSEYTRSDFERRRRWYMEALPPIEQLKPSELEELFVRATRFSVWLRFFDKQIGKSEKGVSHFRRGIEWVLKLWEKNVHPRPDHVEIITSQCETIRDGDSTFLREKKQKRNEDSCLRIQRILLDPLRSTFPFPIRLVLKTDESNIFRDRYLQTQRAIILVTKGFDLFNDDGSVRHNTIKIDNGSFEYLGHVRNLPEYRRFGT